MAIPIRRPVKLPGPTPTAIAVELSPAEAGALHDLGHGGHQLGGVRRRTSERGRLRSDLERLAVIAQHAGGGRGSGGVEAEKAHSILIRRRSPPRCSSRTRAATRSSRGPAASGHSTNATRSGVR